MWFKNVCLVDTPFALSFYLLKMSYEDIQSTYFIVGNSVDKHIVEKLPHYWYVCNQSVKSNWKYMAYLKFCKYIKCWTFPFVNLYAQDHLYIASSIIGTKKYILIPDGPDCFYNWEKSPWQPQRLRLNGAIKTRIKFYLSRGKIYDLKYGMNEQCINRWVVTTKDFNTKYLVNKKYEYLDVAKLWDIASVNKKELIKKIFGITTELLDSIAKVQCIILTQPLREDCNLTNEEHCTVYAQTINSNEGVGIKTHPRDKFDYKSYFKDILVIDTYAPMQLLNYMGFSPNKAVTVCSTSISSMPMKTKKIYLGTKVNPKVYQVYGDLCNN